MHTCRVDSSRFGGKARSGASMKNEQLPGRRRDAEARLAVEAVLSFRGASSSMLLLRLLLSPTSHLRPKRVIVFYQVILFLRQVQVSLIKVGFA